MFSVIATIPLEGSYCQGSLAVARDADDTLLVSWLEIRARESVSMIAMLCSDMSLTVSQLGSGPSLVAITPIETGSFGIVREGRQLLEALVIDRGGARFPFHAVGRRSNRGRVLALSLPDGAIGISSAELLSAYVPAQRRTLIVAATPDAWCAAAATLANGEVVRVTTTQHEPHLHIPRYRIRGQRFAADLMPIDDFSLLLPSRIIGNMHANPQELVVLPLKDSGFVVAWTLSPYHLGSEVQFQYFDSTGIALGSITTAAHSDPSTHIARANIFEGAGGQLLLSWTRTRGQHNRSELAGFSVESGAVTVLHQTEWRSDTESFAITASRAGAAWAVAAEAQRLTVSRSCFG